MLLLYFVQPIPHVVHAISVLVVASLQQVLMSLQQAQLQELSLWLTGMEETIRNYGPIGHTLDAIKQQIVQHKVTRKTIKVMLELSGSSCAMFGNSLNNCEALYPLNKVNMTTRYPCTLT